MAIFEQVQPVDKVLTDEEKTVSVNTWRTNRERNASLVKHCGQTYSLLLGQCTQLLQDKLKQEATWEAVSVSDDPLTLYRLTEKTILAQTEDQYPFATVYDQEQSFYGFRQEKLTSAQWYERFNTKVDVEQAIGVSRHHKVLLQYCTDAFLEEFPARAGTVFADLADDEQVTMCDDAKERYTSYVFLRQSSGQHATLKQDLQNGFITGENRYPKTRQETLHLLDKYSKNAVARPGGSEGSLFAQQQQRSEAEYLKKAVCYRCSKKGHLANKCRQKDEIKKTTKSDKIKKSAGKDADDESVKSNASSARRLKKDLK